MRSNDISTIPFCQKSLVIIILFQRNGSKAYCSITDQFGIVVMTSSLLVQLLVMNCQDKYK